MCRGLTPKEREERREKYKGTPYEEIVVKNPRVYKFDGEHIVEVE